MNIDAKRFPLPRKSLVTMLVGLALALFPAFAGAAGFEVNVSTDAKDTAPADAVCDSDSVTAGNQCSLRAAVESANATPAADEIPFKQSFNVTLATPLEITQPVTVLGCGTPSTTGPCSGLSSSSGEGLIVHSSNVTIRDFAISGFTTGIRYDAGFTGLGVKGNWFGSTLAGVAAGDGVGVVLSGNGAIVGGSTAADRNVFVNGGFIGVEVLGGDGNRIQGNYIGLKADGISAASNPYGVVVGGTAADPAEGNVVGGTVGAAASATTQCDDVCNVISGNQSSGVNLSFPLNGLTPAIGTIVSGNFIGLAASGNTARENGGGVVVGDSEGSQIGGPLSEDRNYVTGGSFAIEVLTTSTGKGAASVIRGNTIGLNSAGTTALKPPSGAGISVNAQSEKATAVVANRIVMTTGIGIKFLGFAGSATGNTIGLGEHGEDLAGGAIGIETGAGSILTNKSITVTGNTVDNSSSVGILLADSQLVKVTGNQIGVGTGHGGGGPGIKLASSSSTPSAGNVIGGEGAEANQIENNAGGGIVIVGGGGQDGNRILANSGAVNGKQFIDLSPPAGPGNEANGPNAGIGAPAIAGAGLNGAGGTARPGSTVRVFTSPAAAGQIPTGLGALVGSATAKASGRWSLTYPTPVAAGTVVAATQTDAAGNSSELSPGAAIDQTVPAAVQIGSPAPNSATSNPKPMFSFSGESSATFLCGFDAAPSVECEDGEFTPSVNLGEGAHVFHVRQFSPGGVAGPDTTRSITIDTVKPLPPEVAPNPLTNQRKPTVAFAGRESGGTFRCAIDNGSNTTWVPCGPTSFTATNSLADGAYFFRVYQIDAAQNEGEPRSYGFTVDATPPPAPTITKAPSSPTKQTNPGFEFSGTTGDYRCAIDAGALSACSSPFSASGLLDGRHSFRVVQVDAANNVSPEEVAEFSVDTVAEPPQIDDHPSDPTSELLPSFVYSGEIGASFECALFKSGAPSFQTCGSNSMTPPSPLSDGRYSFQVRQTDRAGNSSAAATFAFTVTGVAPDPPTILDGPAALTNNPNPVFHFGGVSGASFHCLFSGEAINCFDGELETSTLADGAYTLEVTQSDTSGRESAPLHFAFAVDATPPGAPTIDSGPTGTTTEMRPTFGFHGEAGARFLCALDGSPLTWVECDGGSFQPATALAAGDHTFHVRQIDEAGNAGTDEATRSFTVTASGPGPGPTPPGPGPNPPPRDTTPPNTKIKGPKKLKKPIGKFKLLSTEAGSKFQCKLDRKAFKACKPKLKVKKLKAGKHVLKVRAIDAAGNVDPTPAKKKFKVGH